MDINEASTKPKLYEELKKSGEVILEKLQVWDEIFKCSTSVAVERKEVGDFANSVMSGHIYDQLKNMATWEGEKVLLVYGSPFEIYSKIPLNQVMDALASCILFHISVYFLPNESLAIEFLRYYQRKEKSEGKEDYPTRPKKRLETDKEKIQFIIEGFPKVGAKRAKAIMSAYPTLRKLFTSDLSNIKEKSIRDTIVYLLDKEY